MNWFAIVLNAASIVFWAVVAGRYRLKYGRYRLKYEAEKSQRMAAEHAIHCIHRFLRTVVGVPVEDPEFPDPYPDCDCKLKVQVHVVPAVRNQVPS